MFSFFSEINKEGLRKKIAFLNDWIINMIYKQQPQYRLFDESSLVDENFFESVIELFDTSSSFFTNCSKHNQLNKELRKVI